MKINEFKKLKNMKLSDQEKKDLFNRILNTIKKDDENVKINYPISSPFFRFSFLLKNKQSFVLVFSVFVVFLITTTVFASLDALPGDLLYAIKTNVVEKIPDFVYKSPAKRAENNINKIEKRITEFEKLAEKGRLTEENTKKIEENINNNLSDFDQNVKKIKKGEEDKKGNDGGNTIEKDLEKTLELNLQKHSEKIKNIREDDKVPNKRALESIIERAGSPDSPNDNNHNKDKKEN